MGCGHGLWEGGGSGHWELGMGMGTGTGMGKSRNNHPVRFPKTPAAGRSDRSRPDRSRPDRSRPTDPDPIRPIRPPTDPAPSPKPNQSVPHAPRSCWKISTQTQIFQPFMAPSYPIF